MYDLARAFIDSLSISTTDLTDDDLCWFTYTAKGKCASVYQQLIGTGNYVGLGRLYEVIGTADMMLLHVKPNENPVLLMEACTVLVEATHWYRKGGDAELAALPARRVLVEGGRLHDSGGLRNGPGVTYYHWYLTEMLGDAAAVLDRDLALSYYREALDGFGTVDEDDQMGEGMNMFPGNFLYRTAVHFLENGERLRWVLAEERIPAKIKQWL